MEDIWRAIVDFDTKMKVSSHATSSPLLFSDFCCVICVQKSGEFTVKRKQQQKTWMWAHIELELRDRYDNVITLLLMNIYC